MFCIWQGYQSDCSHDNATGMKTMFWQTHGLPLERKPPLNLVLGKRSIVYRVRLMECESHNYTFEREKGVL